MASRKEILDAWNAIEKEEPDISTERLWAMVMDQTGCDYDDVTDALAEEYDRGEKDKDKK